MMECVPAKRLVVEISQLRQLAAACDRQMLAYLLDVARREAEEPSEPSDMVRRWSERLKGAEGHS